MTDYNELLERLEDGDDLSARLQAATAIRTLLAERQAASGDAKAIMDALWPILGGNHTDAETWQQIGDAVSSVLSPAPDPWNEAIEAAAKVAEKRRTIYAGKWSEADPFGPEAFNRHEYMQHTVEAFDLLLEEIRAIRALKQTEGER